MFGVPVDMGFCIDGCTEESVLQAHQLSMTLGMYSKYCHAQAMPSTSVHGIFALSAPVALVSCVPHYGTCSSRACALVVLCWYFRNS